MSECRNCDGHGIIEGKYCECSYGQMLAGQAKHVAVAYNHETGKKEVFVCNHENPPKPSAAPSESRARFEKWCPVTIIDASKAPKAAALRSAYWTAWQAAERDIREQCARYEHLLMNLLAVIHRDGGHYVAEHGLEKACEDAEKLAVAERGKGAQ